jgi:hypothetical protein
MKFLKVNESARRLRDGSRWMEMKLMYVVLIDAGGRTTSHPRYHMSPVLLNTILILYNGIGIRGQRFTIGSFLSSEITNTLQVESMLCIHPLVPSSCHVKKSFSFVNRYT